MPTDEDLKGYDDAEIRDIINEHHRRRIEKLITQIKRERSRILNDEFSNGGNQVQQTVFYSTSGCHRERRCRSRAGYGWRTRLS